MRRLWLAGILLFLGFLFWQIFAMDPYFYVSAHDLFQRAERALAAGELKEARHWARLAWERDPKNRHYGEFLAWRYLETQQPQEALALFQQLAQQQPPVTVLLGQIQALTHLQRRQEALEVAAAAVKQYPQEVNLLRLTAGLAMQATATQDQALVYYQRLLALEPQDREARQRLVDLLAVRQRYAEAIPLQEQEVAADPDNVQALHQLALLYAWQQDHRAAVPIYRQLLEKAVEDQALRLEAAKNAEAAQDWEQAIVHYLELYTRSGGQKEYALPLARLWSQAGQHGQAAAILAPFMAAAPTVEEQRFYALELLLAGNYGQALQAYRQAWEAGDSHRETILNLARLYGQRQQFRQAAAFWEEARRRQLLDPELRREAALTYAAAHRYQDALTVLAGLTQQDPDLLLFKGQLHFYQKQWRQAVQYYRDYLRQRPQDLAARRQLAQALSFYPAGLAEAAQEYESAALASGDPGLLLQRAAVLLQLAQNTFDDPTQQAAAPERWRAAATALRQVPASDLSPELLRELGRLYLWLGDLEQALACLEKYLVVRPFDRAAQVEKARVLIYLQHGAAAMEVLRRLPPAAAGQSPSPADPAAGGARKNRRQGQHQHPRRPLLPEPRWRF